mmetsp:Transcript_92831/g.267001  ORF Transcript_92831/g.267001 Transcript_92831/m.267001 type:complete len:218 (+) Transcript_92831:976-1629(+)
MRLPLSMRSVRVPVAMVPGGNWRTWAGALTRLLLVAAGDNGFNACVPDDTSAPSLGFAGHWPDRTSRHGRIEAEVDSCGQRRRRGTNACSRPDRPTRIKQSPCLRSTPPCSTGPPVPACKTPTCPSPSTASPSSMRSAISQSASLRSGLQAIHSPLSSGQSLHRGRSAGISISVCFAAAAAAAASRRLFGARRCSVGGPCQVPFAAMSLAKVCLLKV